MMTNPAGRVTQGQFSFLPDLSDAEITQQIDYGLRKGYAWSVEYTDDPHPRNTYWEMFGMPMFDLQNLEPPGVGRPTPPPEGDRRPWDGPAAGAAAVMMELKACRETFPQHYIRLMAFDSTRGIESIAMSFIVNRPSTEPGFGLVRQEADGRSIRYTVHSYATDRPEAERYSG
ncbi:ribulose bisphosphate carboxylase small subunit [Ideonella sp. 4Y16]|uniref:ribulose bisphosphate carboxylase small subunit n=1 Tax=Ideonella alba TaxID=2824118 RepID=UPI001B38FDD2|nr:ribulose bisphosphate carboxylase small subunit [Ideonella alba]MBQ0945546.1 ribulose bisphosphate carboxylase small subunit [Ideonella alba]